MSILLKLFLIFATGNSSNITIKHFIIMARKKGMSHLNVNIKYDKKLKCYLTIIDGDEFWSDNYDHAIIQLIYLLSRDEFSKSKIV